MRIQTLPSNSHPHCHYTKSPPSALLYYPPFFQPKPHPFIYLLPTLTTRSSRLHHHLADRNPPNPKPDNASLQQSTAKHPAYLFQQCTVPITGLTQRYRQVPCSALRLWVHCQCRAVQRMIMRCGVEGRVNSNEGKRKLGKNWSLVVERLVVTIALKGLSAAVWNSVSGHGEVRADW